MKGKIFKIRPGYNPNSSSMGLIATLLVLGEIGIVNIIASIEAASLLYKKKKKEMEQNNYEKKESTN